ncbi:MAG: Eco57I restriction-modification methylase domain-containing protein [Anaerolineae bacterium]|jgi:hypothetical protein|nr:N-6 DNA methylase [Chloroflexota bacterium]
METTARSLFTTIRTEGAILPADLLLRVAQGSDLGGLRPQDYHLAPEQRLNEEINAAWARCLAAWGRFDAARQQLPPGDTGTTLTRERWLLPLFNVLGYGQLQLARGLEAAGQSYPVSHAWGRVPIHLVTFRQELDRRSDVDTALKRGPHSLLQEFLNRSPDYLWGFVSNGLRLRILRDNASLTRQAFVEFDLESMFQGEQYADFAVLWLVCHQSRVEGDDPAQFWLERWSQSAAESGTRALEALRDGVVEAIRSLGRGFLAQRGGAPLNPELVSRLRSGELSTLGYYQQLLRLVYRLIFSFVAEDRDLLLRPDATREQRRIYLEYYSTARLRRLAGQSRGTAHGDAWQGLTVVWRQLHDDHSLLGLAGLGGFLFGPEAAPDLEHAHLANTDLYEALRALSYTVQGDVRRAVDYRNLGPEELGSVYESLLEMHPSVHIDAGLFDIAVAAGSERKTTGSYYTPTSLIQSLLDSALEPVIAERLQGLRDRQEREAAILSIKVLDPACGSGHFLIGAAHRLARELARVRTGEEQPGLAELRAALREVVAACIHGVDINPMAVELCKINLWLETLDPGRPLSFLDANIQCGNSLLGATPRALAEGIPDGAFWPITGDIKSVAAAWRKQNRQEREDLQNGQGRLFDPDSLQPWDRLGNLASELGQLLAMPDQDADDVRTKEEMYAELVRSAAWENSQLWADAWCAAFVWEKSERWDYGLTERRFRELERGPHQVASWLRDEIGRLADQYRFFHWHLRFPHVLRPALAGEAPDNPLTGCCGGFDVVLGNPPWERTKLQEKEWFAARAPDVAAASNAAARKRAIAELQETAPALYASFQQALREADGWSHLLRNSGLYPLCGRGDINTYAVFAELARNLVAPAGRVGIIVPSGIATDATTQYYFRDLMQTNTLVSLYDFENRRKLFPAVDSRMKFCLLTMAGAGRSNPAGASLVFFAQGVEDIRDPQRRFTLTPQEIALINPNTGTCPIFRTRHDAELTKSIYRRVPVLWLEGPPEENPWGIRFATMFHMSNDSYLFRTREQLEGEGWALRGNVFWRDEERCLPLFEGKMLHHFDHRWATYDGPKTRNMTLQEKRNPAALPLPRYWVSRGHTQERLGTWSRPWLSGFRDTARATDERTAIFSVLPTSAVGHKAPLLFLKDLPPASPLLLASLCTIVCDYVARQKVGGTSLGYFILKQVPVLPPCAYRDSVARFIQAAVLELTYTAWDLQGFARDCGYEGPPFRWDPERRFLLRCELDALYFHLYGIAREDVGYILDTFPIVRRRDEEQYGEYRTRRVILEMYDEMAAGLEQYRTRLDPPPADPRVAHGWDTRPDWAEWGGVAATLQRAEGG